MRPVWRRTPLFHVTILATLCIKGLSDSVVRSVVAGWLVYIHVGVRTCCRLTGGSSMTPCQTVLIASSSGAHSSTTHWTRLTASRHTAVSTDGCLRHSHHSHTSLQCFISTACLQPVEIIMSSEAARLSNY